MHIKLFIAAVQGVYTAYGMWEWLGLIVWMLFSDMWPWVAHAHVGYIPNTAIHVASHAQIMATQTMQKDKT